MAVVCPLYVWQIAHLLNLLQIQPKRGVDPLQQLVAADEVGTVHQLRWHNQARRSVMSGILSADMGFYAYAMHNAAAASAMLQMTNSARR